MADVSFNLIDEAWIPCIMITGERMSLGLKDVLCRSHHIEGFDLQNPLEEAALYRLLLALVHRVVDGPKNTGEWKDLYAADAFDQTKVAAYLGKWHHRFDLFSTEAPFFQTAGLQVRDKDKLPRPLLITELQPAKSNGNNKMLFDHSRDDQITPLSAADAAIAILVAQGYLFSGTNRKTTNHFGYQGNFSNGSMVSGLICLLQGDNLYKTLMLNLLVTTESKPLPATGQDAPVWERDEREGTDSRPPRGYLDYLTCKNRHILLIPEVDGEEEIKVSKIHMAQGESFQIVRDPFGIYKKNKNDELIPIQLDTARALWRDSAALFTFSPDADERPKAFRQAGNALARRFVSMPDRHRCIVYGLANKKANPLAWRKEIFHIPTELLSEKEVVERLRFGIRLVEESGEIVAYAARNYVQNCLPENSRGSDLQAAVHASGVMALFWSRAEFPYREFMREVDRGDEALTLLKQKIKRCARTAFRSCFEHRFTSSGKTYKAWVHGVQTLEGGLAKRLGTKGDNK